ncbi:MAG TPA: SIS domain-containing protein [Pseudobacteroides sp.]|nr:SIS domain-containing protein [Pseudobacteroides sp.]
MQAFITEYIDIVKSLMDKLDKRLIEKAIDLIFEAYKSDKQLFIMGNGGSASTAMHFACDIGKGTIIEGKKRFRVISLNDNIALITAISNDYGYEHVFSEQLKNLVNEKDIIVAISASGNSPNLLNAVDYAKQKGAFTISFVGFDGGNLKQKSDLCIHIENYNYGKIEDIHLFLCHIISHAIKGKIEDNVF